MFILFYVPYQIAFGVMDVLACSGDSFNLDTITALATAAGANPRNAGYLYWLARLDTLSYWQAQADLREIQVTAWLVRRRGCCRFSHWRFAG